MKTISVRELQKCIKECVDHSQKACVVVTRHGKPSAILIGVEGKDWEQLVTQTAPELSKYLVAKPRRTKGKSSAAVQGKHEKETHGPGTSTPTTQPQPAAFMDAVRRFIPGL